MEAVGIELQYRYVGALFDNKFKFEVNTEVVIVKWQSRQTPLGRISLATFSDSFIESTTESVYTQILKLSVAIQISTLKTPPAALCRRCKEIHGIVF